MNGKRLTIGITSIGSRTGQSIINSCKVSNMPLYTIGMGMNAMAFGAFDCDEHHMLPSIYSGDYIDQLLIKCEEHKIDILIPSLEDEIYDIALNIEKFKKIGVIPIVSSPEMIEICNDKVKMGKALNQFTDSFVESYNKETLLKKFEADQVSFPLIVKPNGGMGSQGVFLINSETDFSLIRDDHVIQEIAKPNFDDMNYDSYVKNLERGVISQVSEVSIQYIVGKSGKIIGKCATYNKLLSGVPIEIIPFDDPKMWESADSMMPYFISLGLRGPINIQGRMTDKGPKFFEMNARFTGITGLRAIMGFNEVEELIRDHMDMRSVQNTLALNNKRVGIRQLADRAVEYGMYADLDKKVTRAGFGPKINSGRTIMVSGATGFLGRHLVGRLTAKYEDLSIVCLVRDKKRADSMFFNNEKVKVISMDDIDKGLFNMGNVDALIHAAFSKTDVGDDSVSESLIYTNILLNVAENHQIPRIINVSSQEVYGEAPESLWTEELIAYPKTPYASAKWASEILTYNISRRSKHTRSTSLRFANIIEPGMKSDDTSYGLMNLLDVRDASDAIISLLDMDATKWHPIYKVGKGAERIAKDTGWVPKITLEQSFVDMMDRHYDGSRG